MIAVAHTCYMPPKPSRAMWPFPKKTPNNFAGELTFGEERGQGQTLGFGSKLEHDVALMAIYRPGVIDVCEQVEVSFIKADGRPGNHYIDYVVTEDRDRRTAILVKKKYVAVSAKFQDIASRVAFAAIPTVVHRVVIATEAMVDRSLLMRVEQFHSCRFAQPSIDRCLAAALADLEGSVTIRDFLKIAGLGPDGFHGVVRMIRFGTLSVFDQGLLTLSSLVQHGQAKT